jgi:hypothetical protein
MAVPSCYKRRMKDKSLSAAKTGPRTAVKPVARRPRKTGGGDGASRRGAVTGSRAGKAQAVTIEGRKKPPAPSLAQKTWQKRSELMVSELEAVALVMFEQHGFSAVNLEEIAAQARISTARSTGTFRRRKMCCRSGFGGRLRHCGTLWRSVRPMSHRCIRCVSQSSTPCQPRTRFCVEDNTFGH